MIQNKIVLKNDLSFNGYNYLKGDIFTIIGSSFRGWDIQHDISGNIIYECLFIHGEFEELCIKEERKEKLKKILNYEKDTLKHNKKRSNFDRR